MKKLKYKSPAMESLYKAILPLYRLGMVSEKDWKFYQENCLEKD